MIPFRAMRRRQTRLATVAACAFAVAMLSPVAATAAVVLTPPPKPPEGPAVTGVRNATFHFAKPPDQASRKYTASATAWPAAASASVTLAAPTAGAKAGQRGAVVRAAGTPVWAQAIAGTSGAHAGPGSLGIRMLGHAAAQTAGADGVLFTVTPSGAGTGTVEVGLDYTSFAQAYGGNFASRLSLVELPPCALTTPQAPACRVQTPLASANDAVTGTVSAQLPLGAAAAPAVVLAATTSAGQEGGAGGSY